MTATCPVCQAQQPEGLLCHDDSSRLERVIAEVPWLVTELAVSISKQAKIGPGGKGALASERNTTDWDASEMADDLMHKFTGWARDVSGDTWAPNLDTQRLDVRRAEQTRSAARYLLSNIPAIRKHTAVDELVDELSSITQAAAYLVMGPANRTIIYVGPCPELRADDTICMGEVHAYIPRDDDRPARMQCRTVLEHTWSSEQWMRAGKRIADLRDAIAEKNRRVA